jgi:hypothetical protein
MSVRDLIPWGRGRTAPAPRFDDEGGSPLALHRDMNRLFDNFFCGFDPPLPAPPIGSVRIGFPNVAAAERDARYQGLRYFVRPERKRASLPARSSVCPPAPLPDLRDPLLDPARVFTHPRDIAEHPLLSADDKRKLLNRWLWDAYREQTRAGREPAGSRLDEILAALRFVEETVTPPEPPWRGAPAARPWVPELVGTMAA